MCEFLNVLPTHGVHNLPLLMLIVSIHFETFTVNQNFDLVDSPSRWIGFFSNLLFSTCIFCELRSFMRLYFTQVTIKVLGPLVFRSDYINVYTSFNHYWTNDINHFVIEVFTLFVKIIFQHNIIHRKFYYKLKSLNYLILKCIWCENFYLIFKLLTQSYQYLCEFFFTLVTFLYQLITDYTVLGIYHT